MKKGLKTIPLNTLFIVIVLSLSSCTSSLVAMFRTVERIKAGLSEESLQVDDHRIVYLEGGSGEAVLLLHGFGANKDNWTRFSSHLTGRFHVIAVDVPGFGESTKIPDGKYDIDTQVERLHHFLKLKKISKVHIAGNSMGGYIAGLYAARYPDEVLSLGLVDPAGVLGSRLSPVMEEVLKGNNPLVVTDVSRYDDFMKLIFVKQPPIPGFVKTYLAERTVKAAPMNTYIFNQIKSSLLLGERMKNIRTRTLVLWGDRDMVLDVSAAAVLEKGIKNSRVVIMKDCGHCPMVERPEETAKHYLDFL